MKEIELSPFGCKDWWDLVRYAQWGTLLRVGRSGVDGPRKVLAVFCLCAHGVVSCGETQRRMPMSGHLDDHLRQSGRIT
jgi:hypothetical protein